MKYYNKPIEWVDKLYSGGKVKGKVTKRVPVLECKRNSNHCYVVDYAEDRVRQLTLICWLIKKTGR